MVRGGRKNSARREHTLKETERNKIKILLRSQSICAIIKAFKEIRYLSGRWQPSHTGHNDNI